MFKNIKKTAPYTSHSHQVKLNTDFILKRSKKNNKTCYSQIQMLPIS